MSEYPNTKLDRAVDRAIAQENEFPQGLPADVLAGMMEHLRDSPMINALLNGEPIPYYVELRNGNMTIVNALNIEDAKLIVDEPTREVRPADQDDLDHFERMGGLIR